jgi:hypothetical protein
VFTSKPVAPDTFNLYRGLGVEPREGECRRIIDHVHEVICSRSTADAEAMLKLLAWQIQNIGEPSRVIVSMKSEKHQAGGKSLVFGKVMLEIYGQSGFAPSTTDHVIGRFNDNVR